MPTSKDLVLFKPGQEETRVTPVFDAFMAAERRRKKLEERRQVQKHIEDGFQDLIQSKRKRTDPSSLVEKDPNKRMVQILNENIQENQIKWR